MNTIGGHLPILPKDKSRLLFDDKEIDFGFPEWQIDKILSLWDRGKGKEQLEKEISKLEKQMSKISSELYNMDDSNTTVRERANKRMRLSQIGEDIRYKQDYVQEIERLSENEMRVRK